MSDQKVPVSGSLYVGGSKPGGFGAQFYANQAGEISATLALDLEKQGPPGHAHGGSLATLIDEAMGIAAWYQGHRVLAVNLNINFRRAVPLHQMVTVCGRVERAEGRKVYTTGRLTLSDGTVAVEATGLFVTAPQIVGEGDPAPFDNSQDNVE
jgi:uncharacterized protein (TIGR00369 family)